MRRESGRRLALPEDAMSANMKANLDDRKEPIWEEWP